MGEPVTTGGSLIPVDALLRLTGLNRNLLYAWERRYGLLPEARDSRGVRLYTQEQAARLMKLRQAVDDGHRIGTIARLGLAELDALAPAGPDHAGLGDMIAAAANLDTGRIANLLRMRLRAEGVQQWVLGTILPLMSLAGDLWEENRLTVTGEHVLSLGSKQVLLACLTDLEVPAGAETAIVTTLENEFHEFGAVSATILARLNGIDARYLGPCLPIREIATAAARLKVRYVIVSAISLPADMACPAILGLRMKLPADIVLIAGGNRLDGLPETPNLRVERNLSDFSLMNRQPP